MKVVILAGGFGTRLSEETINKPKPMVEIGGKPILWHILNIYAAHGFREFIIALGYRGDIIKEYFRNFYVMNNDISIDLSNGDINIHDGRQPDWKVHLVDTGLDTLKGGRIKRIRSWLGDDDTFMLTYGDGVADVDIGKLVAFHKAHGCKATVTTVRPAARFGGLRLESDRVVEFVEKPQTGEGWINGGFFVLEKSCIDYIYDETTDWEREPLERLAEERELKAFKHQGFWQPMDTLREKVLLDELWRKGQAPWKVW